MKHIERTITVDKPLSRVWEYLSDFTSTNDWDTGTVETVRKSGDGGVGTVYHNTSKFLGKETEVVYTVQRVEPQRLIQLQGVNESLTATDTITFAGDESRTEVTYRAEFELKGAAKVAGLASDIRIAMLTTIDADGPTNPQGAVTLTSNDAWISLSGTAGRTRPSGSEVRHRLLRVVHATRGRSTAARRWSG